MLRYRRMRLAQLPEAKLRPYIHFGFLPIIRLLLWILENAVGVLGHGLEELGGGLKS